MSITEKQRQERQRYLGASDIAAIFTDESGHSLDPFKKITDVYVQKCFELEPEKETSESIKSGVRWEPYLLDWAAQELGVTIETDPDKLHFVNNEIKAQNGQSIFASNLDGYYLLNGENIIVEAKKSRLWKEWGEENTDQAPDRVILQVSCQMLCTGWKKAYVAAMIQGDEKLFPVDRNEAIINAIKERGLWFWNNFVLTKIAPPSNEPGNIDILKRIRRRPETFAEVDSALILNWEAAKNERIEAEKHEKELLAEVLVKIGDTEGVYLADGRVFMYLKQRGADVIDRMMLKAQYPEIYNFVAKENTYRVARIKKSI